MGFFLNNRYKNENKSLLNLIPKKYLPCLSATNEDISYHCKNNNLHYIKYISIILNNKNILDSILKHACWHGKLEIIEYVMKKRSKYSYK